MLTFSEIMTHIFTISFLPHQRSTKVGSYMVPMRVGNKKTIMDSKVTVTT